MRLSIVSYLDPQATLKVRKIQKELSDLTGSMSSFKTWEPHLTVGDGVEVEDGDLESFLKTFKKLALNITSFELKLSGLGTMDNWVGGEGETFAPYVIYLDVDINENLLKLVKDVSDSTANMSKWYVMPKPFQPHCTLAFRDLSKDGFRIGIEFLSQQELDVSTSIDHIALVEMLPEGDHELIRFELAYKDS